MNLIYARNAIFVNFLKKLQTTILKIPQPYTNGCAFFAKNHPNSNKVCAKNVFINNIARDVRKKDHWFSAIAINADTRAGDIETFNTWLIWDINFSLYIND